MDIDQALKNIKQTTNKFAKEEVLFIKDNIEEAIPTLIEYIKEVIDLGEDMPEEGNAHLYAMFLLAEFKIKAAFEYLIKYLEFDEDLIEICLGDTITEDFCAILASVATVDDIPQIKAIIENPTLYVYNRNAALNALKTLYAEDIYDKNEYFAYLQYLLENCQDDPELMAEIIISCEETGNQAFLPVIERLYEADLVDDTVTGLSEVRQGLLAANEETAKQALKKDPNNSFINDTISRMSWWACFGEQSFSYEKPIDEHLIVNEKPDFGYKVGRNDPCPCGSGKKYKNCCGK
ncbi:MAG: DUF1186 domain-containing protein [Synergistaceae bacterium]|nr:DUF1186 domain-containing protein [Synergistaceae bacterium]